MSDSKVYHAKCLCSEVEFTLTGDPFHFVVCHCRNCKQVSGSAFLANTMFKHAQLNVTRGQEFITNYADSNTLSGNTITRSFCSSCGSTLFIKPAKDHGFFITHPSLIEEDISWVPNAESFAHERLAWVNDITLDT
ncbi:hypothetical protein JR316_0008354 [Psilocybe cubensis]|uniref:Uncharacterized protein n=1 Tax=Psilocybe cubensis TaxID=181762 RepID=A0ACB8GWC2_PSICU|nr:hypothetical protein JR316_0008354 [Psilocybe cubensis]KAH9479759.1 hypothetical protein JR316_0008354 [Psilocybe cubensis]